MVDQPGTKERTPLFQACEWGYVEIIDMLLDHGADLHKGQGSILDSPILRSCYTAQLHSFKALLRRGASVTSVDKHGNTCFHKVVLCPKELSDDLRDILHTLVGAGADINKPNKFGYSPLYYVCAMEKDKLIEYFFDAKCRSQPKDG